MTRAAPAAVARGNAMLAPVRMRLIGWRPVAKGALVGFANVELPIGLRIFDVPVFANRNGGWASLPSKPLLDQDGRQKLGADGKPAYSAMGDWKDRDLTKRFSQAVVELVRRRHPEALDGRAG